jgi:hypothetical protein
MIDLFGNERPEGCSEAVAATVSLFDATAERLALASGRTVSQERIELVYGVAPALEAR